MPESLKSKAISGAKWNAFANIGKYFVTFFLSIILARVLAPNEFGLIGMISIFSIIANVFINSGLLTPLIRKPNPSDIDFSTVFYFNISVSSFFYILLFFTAPYISSFYNEPLLIPITRLISLVFVFNSFGIVQNAILIRNLNFRKQTLINLTSLTVSVIIAILMALNGFGVYSIVAQAISQSVFVNSLLWISSKWKPKSSFSLVSFKEMWVLASKILSANIISQLVDNLDNLLIGKVFSANQLGFYMRAKSTKELPEGILTSILHSVSFPILSKISDNKTMLRNLHLKFFSIASFIIFPIAFGLIAISKAFIVLLYTEKWLPSVPLLQMISLSIIAPFFSALFSQTIMAIGHGSLYFKLTSSKKIIGLLPIPIGILFGLNAFILIFVCSKLIGLFLDFYYTGKLIDISIAHYLRLMLKPFLCSLCMSLLVFCITKIDFENNLFLLSSQIFIGITLYSSLSYFFQNKEFKYIINIIISHSKLINKKVS